MAKAAHWRDSHPCHDIGTRQARPSLLHLSSCRAHRVEHRHATSALLKSTATLCQCRQLLPRMLSSRPSCPCAATYLRHCCADVHRLPAHDDQDTGIPTRSAARRRLPHGSLSTELSPCCFSCAVPLGERPLPRGRLGQGILSSSARTEASGQASQCCVRATLPIATDNPLLRCSSSPPPGLDASGIPPSAL
jgi:hypothetical protein